MLGRLDVLGIISVKLERQIVSVQDVTMLQCGAKIDTSGRLICAIDFAQ